MGASYLKVKSDSQLVTGQVNGVFQTKDPVLTKYLEKVKAISSQLQAMDLTSVPRKHNVRADLLSKLASTKRLGNNRSVIQETLHLPSIEDPTAFFVEEE